MSELDLDALERLNAERTQGVWVSREDLLHDAERWGVLMEIHAREAAIDAQGHSYAIFGVDEEFVGDNPILQCCGSAEAKDTPNAEFIAAAANAMPELLRLARRAADAERERDEARADRDRVLTVATSALTERDVVRHRLRELCEKCAPFSAYAGELFARNGLAGSVVLGTHDPDGKYLSITIGDFFNLRAALSRELARAVKEGE